MELIENNRQDATLELGFSHIKNGALEKAMSVMDKLLEDDPYLAPAYWGRALCIEYGAETAEDVKKAISDYSKSIVYSAEPSSLSYGRRGILYFKLGMYAEAIADLDKALETDFYWIEARFYRGRAYLAFARDDSDIKTAVDDFSEVIRLVPEPFAPAHFWRGQAFRQLDRGEEAVSDYRIAIEADPLDVLALNALGYCAEHGVGMEVDRYDAEVYYEKAAQLGFTVAQKNLAWFYTGGENGEDEDAEGATYWMHRAALDGDAEAQNLYGLRKLYGKGTKKGPSQAVHYFELASAQGNLAASCNLADCYERGLGVKKDASTAFSIYERTAGEGSRLARYNVGRHYYFGIGVPEDNEKAFNTLKPLADEGYARAQDMVGMCYENGYGVPRDIELAGKYYKLAYAQGHVHAAAHLAARYRSGRGVKKNLAKAIKLYTESGEKGSSYAWRCLGDLYFEEKHEFEKAADAYRKAVKMGEIGLSHMLAASLLRGKSPKANLDEAILALKKAVSGEDRKLVPAVMLAELEMYGFCGRKPDPKAAVKLVLKNIPENSEEEAADTGIEGLSCACAFLSRAYELGLGVKRDIKAAADYCRMAENVAENPTMPAECHCYAAVLAHMLYQKIIDDRGEDSAEKLLAAETEKRDSGFNAEAALLYVWAVAPPGKTPKSERPRELLETILLEDPHNVLAAYMIYLMDKDSPTAEKKLKRLNKNLKLASPYARFKIERHMKETPNGSFYPMLTAEDIDAYNRAN